MGARTLHAEPITPVLVCMFLFSCLFHRKSPPVAGQVRYEYNVEIEKGHLAGCPFLLAATVLLEVALHEPQRQHGDERVAFGDLRWCFKITADPLAAPFCGSDVAAADTAQRKPALKSAVRPHLGGRNPHSLQELEIAEKLGLDVDDVRKRPLARLLQP